MDKRLAMAAMLAAIDGGSMYAADRTGADVYISDRDGSSELLGPGKVLASAIFGKIGVRLNWRAGELPATHSAAGNESIRKAFGVRTLQRAPESATEGALASARVVGSSGTEIMVYKDRLQRFLANHSNLAGVMGTGAGYVLAHELAHVMQGVSRHSESGILKAQWSNTDFDEMIFHKLVFTNFDVELIYRGLAVPSANHRSALPAEAKSEHPAGSDLAKR